MDTNQVAKRSAINPATGEIGFDTYNNPTDVWEYDFGQGSVGQLIRHTHTDYLRRNPDPGGPNYQANTDIHIRNLPTQVSIFDASGIQQAQTAFEYDNYAADVNHAPLVDRPFISGMDPAFNTSYQQRGNATKISQWLNTGGTVDIYKQYDIAGNVVKSIDALGNATVIDYSGSFQFAYPTQTTSPVPDPTGATGSNTALITTTNYDPSTGLIISITDPNGQITSVQHNDPLDRPTAIVRPTGGGTTSYSYSDLIGNLFVWTQVAQDASQSQTSDQLFDGLGRAIETRKYEPGGGYISTQQKYDGMGRVNQVSNPFRPALEGALWTTTQYDSLGRVVSVTTPDGAAVASVYAGNQTTVRDQANKQRRSATDAAGRLVMVEEMYEYPSVAVYATTRYAYDALDDLRTVTQGGQSRTFAYDSLKRLKQAANPESGIVNYSYDSNGNLTQKTDARGVITNYAYDGLNRATSRSYSDGTPAVSYKYDLSGINSKGRLTSVTIAGGTDGYFHDTYDAMGRASACHQVTGGVSYSTSYGYDLAGNLISQIYPSGRTVSTSYDSAGRVTGVSGQKTGEANKTYASAFSYASHGAVNSMTAGNNLVEKTSYNNRLQPFRIQLGSSASPSSVFELGYDYGGASNNGNVLSETMTIGATAIGQTYDFDQVNRLKTATEAGGWSQTYSYDQFGNRAVSGYVPSALTPQSLAAFNASNNRMTGSTYDGAGNQTLDAAGSTFSYDAENRQITSNVGGVSVNYGYDGDGRRVKKVVGTGATIFVYNVQGQLIAEYTDAASSGGGGTSYVTQDHLGSTRVVTDSSGNVKARHDYLPFGEEIPATIAGRTSIPGYSATDTTKQRFSQKERDSESGLDFFATRYYASTQGRFTSTDAVYFQKEMLADPQRFNLYVYTRNNPLKFVDPSGMILYISAQGDPDEVKRWLQTLADKFADKLSFVEIKDSNGNVTGYDVQFNVSEKDIAGREGAKLVYDLVNSDKTFLAQAGGGAEFKYKNDPKGIIHSRNADEDPGNITRNRPGQSGNAEPADPKVDSIILVSRTVTFVDQGGRGEVVERISFFIHEASESYLLAQGIDYGSAHGYRYGQIAPAHGSRTKYVLPWNNAISREARIRLELDIKGGFAGGELKRRN